MKRYDIEPLADRLGVPPMGLCLLAGLTWERAQVVTSEPMPIQLAAVMARRMHIEPAEVWDDWEAA